MGVGGGCVGGGGGGVKLDQLGGGACPKRLKTSALGHKVLSSDRLHRAK